LIRDTYDKDPNTSGMYDDGHVYTNNAGSLNWKFAGGPKAEYDASIAANKPALVQHKHHHHRSNKDTYDKDPTSSSMYDDGHVYTDKPGSLSWKYPAEVEAPVAKSLVHQKHHHHNHGGHKDTFDHDPNTVSMYDDQHVYSIPGKFDASTNAASAGKKSGIEKDTAPASNPEAPALVQHTHITRDTYDHDPTTTGMYDDSHVYTDKSGSLNWKYAGGPKAEYDASIKVSKVALLQQNGNKKDTFDNDADTASMYDD